MAIDTEMYRRRLIEDLEKIEADLVEARNSASTVVLDQSSVGRLSRMDALQQQAMAQGIRARMETRKRQLQAALARMDAGAFGRCCQCEVELEPERLNNDPAVVFCSDCMAEREARDDA